MLLCTNNIIVIYEKFLFGDKYIITSKDLFEIIIICPRRVMTRNA